MLAVFTFTRLASQAHYVTSGEITINAPKTTDDPTRDAIKWSDDFGTNAANNSFDPYHLAMHMLGHVVRLQHFETIHPGKQHYPCGSNQEGRNKTAVSSVDGNAISVFKSGDDNADASGLNVDLGANSMVESSKKIPLMFPYMNLGAHCRNPQTGDPKSNKAKRYQFTEEENEAIRKSATYKRSL